MARTGQKQAEQASSDYANQANQAYGGAQGDIGQYRANEAKLIAGQNVGADPWQSASYLGNQNRLTSDALNSQNNAASQDIRNLNARTGGLNSGGTAAAIGSLALQKMRLGNQLGAQRSAADFNKNVAYQGTLAGMPLAAAGAEGNLYGTATGGRTGANSQLTQFGLQSQNFWDQLANKGIDAATAAAGGAGGGPV